ncbi:lysosomal alpha-glucosidase-like [Daktulosphaira vitifoliae]|uniref:lysosomal alpha-glucosidase-like n=1 Tax=Daktulosphaira vitifoliae TaxID=58002 RepID=UPI0021AAA830|nr:lysosomal alpha-glucosidase-like [Daktulosphaira vitifoliae]
MKYLKEKMNNKQFLKSDFCNYNSISGSNKIIKSNSYNCSRVFTVLAAILLIIAFSYTCIQEYEKNTFESQFLKREIKTLNDGYLSKKLEDKICSITSDIEKFDCFPRGNANQDSCEQRNCCWSPIDFNSKPPWCYYPKNYNNYILVNMTETNNGIMSYFRLINNTTYTSDIKLLCVEISFQTIKRLHIKIFDAENKRYEPPYPEVPTQKNKELLNSEYTVSMDKSKVAFSVIRKIDNVVLFDSKSVGGFIYSNQFIQISAVLPTKYIYGIGEHRSNLTLDMNWKTYTLFNHDSIPTNNINGYGSHPFYLIMEKSGKSHGVFLFNSNAMDVILQPTPAITFRVIGGILDFYYFLGPTPAEVITQYTEIIGRPFLPPYWSLGFHLCRFGQTFSQLIEVHNKTINAGIPWDTHWNDIDYMKNRNDFTLSDDFAKLPDYVHYLHKIGMHSVLLLDPGVSSREPNGTYPPYDVGLKQEIFIKNSSGLPLEGQVWNRDGGTVFPDFTNPKIVNYWIDQLSRYHNLVPYDGLWIDMNEPSNFVNGDWQGCAFNDSYNWENPQYIPNIQGGVLKYKTICMSAEQHSGRHYDLHNLYGFTEAIITQFALTTIRNTRPFVLSRSSFSGFGHFAGHWTGDVFSTWDDMSQSITDIIVFNMFGIPLIGADICGFNGNTTVELCSRWSQLGAFYPFSRNHNSEGCIDQDPVSLGQLVVESARKALMIRYSLLPYLYSLFWKAHIYGETVVRPLFFEYFYDENTYEIDKQFLWGSALMICPVLSKDEIHVNIYLPNDLWYDYYTKEIIISNGSVFTLPAPPDTIPLLLRGGYVLPTQVPATTTKLSRKNPFGLIVTPDKSNEASGYLFWDDGDSLDVWENALYNEVHFTYKNSVIISEVITNNYIDENVTLHNITIFGVNDVPKYAWINNKSCETYFYNKTENVLYFQQLNVNLFTKFNVTWA